MISNKSITAAEALVDCLQSQRRNLTPLPGSLLSGLVGSITGLSNEVNLRTLVELSGKENNALGGHSAIAAEALPTVTKILSNIVDVAKNEINGRIKSVLSEVESENAKAVAQQGGRLPEIEFIERLDIQGNGSFRTLIEAFRESPWSVRNPAANAILSNLVDMSKSAPINKTVKTGVSSIDADLAKLIPDDGPSCLDTVLWVVDNITRQADGDTAPRSDRYDARAMVIAFLVFHNIHAGRNDVASGAITGNETSKLLVVEAMAAIGRHLNMFFVADEKLAGTKSIIADRRYHWVSADHIAVIGTNYRKWLEEVEGASPEALMGYAISGMSNDASLYDPEAIKAYLSAYEGRLKHIAMMSKLTRERDNRQTVIRVITRMIADETNSSIEERTIKGTRLSEAIAKAADFGVMPVREYALRLVAATWDASPDSMDYLRRVQIELDRKERPTEDDVDMARFIAMCKLVAHWVVSQTVLADSLHR